jgi:hypothetical protein
MCSNIRRISFAIIVYNYHSISHSELGESVQILISSEFVHYLEYLKKQNQLAVDNAKKRFM